MNSTKFSASDVQELELKLYRYLGLPAVQPGARPTGIDKRFESAALNAIRELRRELFELRRDASQIGRIPLDYPRHVVFVMKIISALLPWYTRPLHNFARRTAHISDISVQLLDEVVKSHENLARQVEEMSHPAQGDHLSRSRNNG